VRIDGGASVPPPQEVQMPYSYKLTTTIPASPEEIYEAWLDSLIHSEMTGGEATMSDQIGADVSAWDGFIRGRNLELVPGERIVQSWRTSEFGDEHEDSIVTIVLEETDDGTLLVLEHSNVPEEQKSYEEGGWQSYYFEPMVAYFSERSEGAEEAAPQKTPQRAAPKKSARGPAAKEKAKKRTAGAGKAKRAASAKPKRAAPKKAAAKKSKTKGGVKARSAAARKRGKASPRKSGRGKR